MGCHNVANQVPESLSAHIMNKQTDRRQRLKAPFPFHIWNASNTKQKQKPKRHFESKPRKSETRLKNLAIKIKNQFETFFKWYFVVAFWQHRCINHKNDRMLMRGGVVKRCNISFLFTSGRFWGFRRRQELWFIEVSVTRTVPKTKQTKNSQKYFFITFCTYNTTHLLTASECEREWQLKRDQSLMNDIFLLAQNNKKRIVYEKNTRQSEYHALVIWW